MENLLKHGEYKSTIKSGSHGEKFQEEIALALSLRMLATKSNFGLGYEVTEARPFDDIVLLEDGENGVIHFMQVKHQEGGTVKSIGSEAFIPAQESNQNGRGDYNLRKYLESYIDIQSNLQTNNYKRYFYIVTNRRLSEFRGGLTIEDKEGVNELLMFPKSSDSPKNPKKLNPTQNKKGKKPIDILRKWLNPNIEEIKESLINLFEKGTVDKILKDYSTPLNEVIEIDENRQCSFKNSFLENPSFAGTDDSKQSYSCHLYNILIEENSENPILYKKTKIAENFLLKESENTRFPVYASKGIVEAFFEDLTLLVDQLDSLRETIHEELQKWLRTWVQPDIFGKMSYQDMDQLYFGLTDTFKKWIKSCNNDSRTLLNSDTIQGWLEELRKKNKKLENEDETKRRELYVNRQILHAVGQSISDTEFAEKFKTIFNDQQLIAVVAGPGMGKTSLFKFLAFEIQKQNDSKVFLVYFYGLVKALDKIEGITGFDAVVSVLEAVLSEENCKIIRNAPVQRDNEGCSIFLFMDGFDEVPARHNQKVMEMLKQLKSRRSIQIVISSRKRTQNSLEGEFGIKSLFVVPFTVQNQIDFLKKRWNIPHNATRSVRDYLESLLEKYHSSISSNLCDISKLPLMMETLAKMQQEEFEASKIKYSKATLNFTELLGNFVENCFNHKLVEKTGGDFYHPSFGSLKDGFILDHQLLAIKLLDNEELAETVFENKTFKTKCEKFQYRCERDTETSLLIRAVGEVQACDLLCIEYLAAKYMSDYLVPRHVECFLRFLSEHKVVRNLTMIMFDENIPDMLNEMYQIDWHIALWACESGSYNIVNSLKESVSSDVRNMMLRTAAQHNFVNICDLLINNKADPNDSDQEKQTALHLSAQGGHIQVIRLLIKSGAITSCKTNAGETPLHFAAAHGHRDAAKLLNTSRHVLKAADIKKRTALHMASENGHVSIVELLLRSHPKVDAFDENKWTPLHLAALGGHDQVVGRLLNARACATSRTNAHETPLHMAAKNGHATVVKVLLRRGVNVHALDDNNATALQLATQAQHCQVIQLLIDTEATG